MKPRVAVHKFSSCDGCQLALLNLGEDLLRLNELVDIVHFAEAGWYAEDTPVELAFVEGSISTPHELERIRQVRANSKYLITMGACATAGGLQALRNMADGNAWLADIYASPQHIPFLPTSTAVAQHVRVDLELWGCPVNSRQLLLAVRDLLSGVAPRPEHDKVCMECKRIGNVCVLVTRGQACMGPVTRTGCGALCPSVGRACYACFGPAENARCGALAARFTGFGLLPREIAQRFLFINSGAPEFKAEGERWREGQDV